MTASELDVSFAHFLPPIFRVVLMTALCILGFAMDLQVLQYWDMNIFLGAGPTLLPVSYTHLTLPTSDLV